MSMCFEHCLGVSPAGNGVAGIARLAQPATVCDGQRSRRAFTLLEVLMALVIFAMAAVVLGSAYVNVLTGYDVAARGLVVDEDVAHARQLLLNESDREIVEDGGEFDTADGRRAKWSAEITSTNLADLFNVTFTCEIPDPNRPEPRQVVEHFVLLRPTWSNDAGERGKLKEQTKTKILELQSKLPSAAGVTR